MSCLPDGRRAEFKHTSLRRRMVHAFLERRDAMLVASSTLVAKSSIVSRFSTDPSAAFDAYSDLASSLTRAAFPYAKIDPPKISMSKEALISAMFDKLHEIKESLKVNSNVSDSVEKDNP